MRRQSIQLEGGTGKHVFPAARERQMPTDRARRDSVSLQRGPGKHAVARAPRVALPVNAH